MSTAAAQSNTSNEPRKQAKHFTEKREGSLAMGDMPLFLRSCVSIEGDLYWKVVWQAHTTISLTDSFETEVDL